MQDFSEQSAYLALIQEVLLSVRYLSPPQQLLYLLLQNNIDKLNNSFVISLELWTIVRTVFIWPNGLPSLDFEPLWIIKSMSAPPLTRHLIRLYL